MGPYYYVYQEDIKSSELRLSGLHEFPFSNPESVEFSNDGAHFYVAHDDNITWFSTNSTDGALEWQGSIQEGENGALGLSDGSVLILSSDDQYLYVGSANEQTLSWFQRDQSTGGLTFTGIIRQGLNGVDSLADMSSMSFSADGKLYVVSENNDTIGWFDRDATSGGLTYGGGIKDGENGVDGLDGATGITFSPDGSFAYVTATVDNSISWFARNQISGSLTYLDSHQDGIAGIDDLNGTSRLVLSGDGNYAYVTARNDNAISWFQRNNSSGALVFMGKLSNTLSGFDWLQNDAFIEISEDGDSVYLFPYNFDAMIRLERNISNGSLSYYSENNPTYIVKERDIGGVISVTASYVNDYGEAEFMASQGTSMVEANNSSPVDLNATAPLTIAENQPIGTVVGEFNATDPEGHTLTYQLVSGAGDTDNARFSLGSNGILTANQTFNYSTDSLSYSIRVQVKDELNATAENSFTIQLLDDPSDNPIELTMSSTRGVVGPADQLLVGIVVVDGTVDLLIKGLGPSFPSSEICRILNFQFTIPAEHSSRMSSTGRRIRARPTSFPAGINPLQKKNLRLFSVLLRVRTLWDYLILTTRWGRVCCKLPIFIRASRARLKPFQFVETRAPGCSATGWSSKETREG